MQWLIVRILQCLFYFYKNIDIIVDSDLKKMNIDEPNNETIAALNEYNEMKSNPQKYKRYLRML